MSLKDKIKQAAEYIKNGDPLRDAMDECDIMDAILLLAGKIAEDNAFDDWFDTGGYDKQHYDMFEMVWTAARAHDGVKHE